MLCSEQANGRRNAGPKWQKASVPQRKTFVERGIRARKAFASHAAPA